MWAADGGRVCARVQDSARTRTHILGTRSRTFAHMHIGRVSAAIVCYPHSAQSSTFVILGISLARLTEQAKPMSLPLHWLAVACLCVTSVRNVEVELITLRPPDVQRPVCSRAKHSATAIGHRSHFRSGRSPPPPRRLHAMPHIGVITRVEPGTHEQASGGG